MASIPTQEEVLAATRKSQEAMMATVKTWFDAFRTTTPKLPRLPQIGLPFVGKLPTPQEAVGNAYHLAEQLLASQRRFAEELVKATAPLRPGYRESSPEVPSPRAWQEAVTEPKAPAVVAAPKAAPSPAPKAAPKAAESAAPKTAPSTAPNAAPKAAESAAPKPKPNEHVITAPMVGTFYASPSPGAKAFVEIGDEIKVGQVLCIIEAMKMMNQIEADKAGRITSVMAQNGDPVEFGQPLFVVE